MCGWVSAQTSNLTETKNNTFKSTTIKLKENSTIDSSPSNVKVLRNEEKFDLPGLSARQQTNGVQNQNSGTEDIRILSAISSTGEKPIAVFVRLGENKIQNITIQNSGDSPLLWSIAPAGTEKLLFRLYDENRDLLAASLTDSNKLSDAVPLIVYQNKLSPPEIVKQENGEVRSEDFSTIFSVVGNQNKNNEGVILNSLSNSVKTEFPENFNHAIDTETKDPHTETPDPIQKINASYFFENSNDGDFLPQLKIFNDYDNANYLSEQLQKFRKWYTFEECGYPKFHPAIEVWEVTSDNGDHWQQIFQIDGEPYVIRAQCFNPVDFLERHCTDEKMSWTSALTPLKELLYSVQTQPSIYSGSGIIQARDSEHVELSFDASTLDNGIYNSQLVLINKMTNEVLKVLPIEYIVKPKIEDPNSSSHLLKQFTAEQLPDRFGISQNYPNPFNPETKIDYSIKSASLVSLKVYDILGNEIVTLVNERKDAGFYSVIFNASDFTSGIYFYQLNADNFVETKKMILLR